MKNWKIITIATLAVLSAALLVSTVAAMGPFGSSQYGGSGGMMGGRVGGGMMGSYGYGPYTNPQTQTGSPNNQATYPFQSGGGCLARNGFNNYVAPNYNTGTGPVTIDTATTIAQNYVAALGNPDLIVKHVEEYTNNFYVQVNELSTGNGAFELLINKSSGSIYPEMGPNMMWNTKYGMMRGGILGGTFGTTTTTTVTQTQATTKAQQYLTIYLPGTTTGDVTTFYGYYTIEVLKGSTPYGMLSVNGYSGQVWYHNWHGTFIQELQVS
jgi:hypothetical protein